jgi:hypothetical protein
MKLRQPLARAMHPWIGTHAHVAGSGRRLVLFGHHQIFFLAAILAALTLQGCSTPPTRGEPLPEELSARAMVPGIPGARRWGDERPAGFDAWLTLPQAELEARYGGVMHRPHSYLVISGGGSDGAFGAGLLNGWSEHGNRPEFQIVTGISTGALMAPFAFLGSDYDPVLREMYTRYATKDLIEPRTVLDIIRGDAAADTRPLRRLIAAYVNDEVIASIAAEGRKGRSLLVGTTNLDAARPVIWDITRIAASSAPGARELIHDVILASASIPGAFPPVLIEVEADGRRYDEMHVDGGVTGQLFFGAKGIDWDKVVERLGVVGKPTLYLVRNGRLTERWDSVRPRLIPVATRTVSSLIRSQAIGDLAKVYILAKEYKVGFHLAFIPDEFDVESSEPFDPTYMKALFELGYSLGRQGSPWETVDE